MRKIRGPSYDKNAMKSVVRRRTLYNWCGDVVQVFECRVAFVGKFEIDYNPPAPPSDLLSSTSLYAIFIQQIYSTKLVPLGIYLDSAKHILRFDSDIESDFISFWTI